MIFVQNERDVVLMKHEFVFSESDGTESRRTSSLIVYGDHESSAMAKTVCCKLLSSS